MSPVLDVVLNVLTVDFCGQMELQGISIGGAQATRAITMGMRTALHSMERMSTLDFGMMFRVIGRTEADMSARNH